MAEYWLVFFRISALLQPVDLLTQFAMSPLAPSTENTLWDVENHGRLRLREPGLVHPLNSKELLPRRLGPLWLL